MSVPSDITAALTHAWWDRITADPRYPEIHREHLVQFEDDELELLVQLYGEGRVDTLLEYAREDGLPLIAARDYEAGPGQYAGAGNNVGPTR